MFHSPQTQRNHKFVESEKYLESWRLHPTGQAVAISTSGKVFTFDNWEGAVQGYDKPDNTQETDDPGTPVTSVRYRLPQWLNDGKRLIAVTETGGEETFAILHTDGSAEPEYLLDLDIGRPGAVAVNPRKDQIVFSNHHYEIVFLDLPSRELRVVDRSKARPISGFSWSPDGDWVAHSVSVSLQIKILELWHATSGEITSLTQPVLRDVDTASLCDIRGIGMPLLQISHSFETHPNQTVLFMSF